MSTVTSAAARTRRTAAERPRLAGAALAGAAVDPDASLSRRVEKLHGILWFAIVVLSPLYVWSPGLPQPFHLLAILALAAGFARLLPLILVDRELVILLWAFLGYVTLVNFIWYALLEDSPFVFSTLYLLFNGLIFLYVVALVRLIGPSVIALTAVALAMSTAIEICLVMFGLSELHPSGGAVGSFTNPNQLGHWAVLTVAALLILKRNDGLTVLDGVAIAAAVVLTCLSLSRAGMVSMALLLAGGGLFARKSVGLKVSLVVAAAAVLVALSFNPNNGITSFGLEPASAELVRHTQWDSPGGRGYDRIWMFPGYLLLGAGEGGFDRFVRAPLLFHNELHSSFGTILFSYGVVGTILLIAFFITVFRKTDWRMLIVFAPVFMFGLVHNTFRFSFFWMVLGLGYAVCSLRTQPVQGHVPPSACSPGQGPLAHAAAADAKAPGTARPAVRSPRGARSWR